MLTISSDSYIFVHKLPISRVDIPYIIVDIAPSPTGTLDLFNLYGELSRSSGREAIQDFDEEMFKKSHDTTLTEEYERLQKVE